MKISPVGVELFNADGQTRRRMYRQAERQTGRHDESKSRFSPFYERTQTLSLPE
jgi:hypothetical protein